MSTPASINSEEKIIVALACLIGILFLLFAPLSCKPGATAFSLSSLRGNSQDQEESGISQAASDKASMELALERQEAQAAATEVAARDLKAASSSSRALQNQSSARPSNNLTEAAFVGAVANNRPADSDSTLNASLASNPASAEEEAIEAEKARIINEGYLSQIEELAAESNALKEERRQRILSLAETKKEYAATLKFAQGKHQQEMAELERQNKILTDKLAGGGAPEGTETPEEPTAPDNEDPASRETPAEEEMPAETTEDPATSETEEAPENPKAPAFAQSDEDLDQSRRSLVNAIRDMDPLSGDTLATRYKELESELGTTSAGRVRFVSGSSKASEAELEKVTKLADTAKADSQFLIVGFADRSGSTEGNRKLSSARAKFVAEQLGNKVGYARVQAIYIGQTARFGKSSENRVVEIWEIPATPPKP